MDSLTSRGPKAWACSTDSVQMRGAEMAWSLYNKMKHGAAAFPDPSPHLCHGQGSHTSTQQPLRWRSPPCYITSPCCNVQVTYGRGSRRGHIAEPGYRQSSMKFLSSSQGSEHEHSPFSYSYSTEQLDLPLHTGRSKFVWGNFPLPSEFIGSLRDLYGKQNLIPFVFMNHEQIW